MNALVEYKHKMVVTDSRIVAREFGMKHAKVLLVIENILNDFPDLRVLQNHPKTLEFITYEDRVYRGQSFKVAIMNRPFFSLLAGRFETKRAREWYRKFNGAFYEMEKRLLITEANKTDEAWIGVREQTKFIRHYETDVIKQFIEYATGQGSKNAQFYYKHITDATYRALGLIQHNQPKLRDSIQGLELGWLIACEDVAKQSLSKHMEAGEHYKAIFVLVKQDIEKYAEGLMSWHVPAEQA